MAIALAIPWWKSTQGDQITDTLWSFESTFFFISDIKIHADIFYVMLDVIVFFLLSPKNTLSSTLSARLRESSYVLVVSNTLWCLCYMMLAIILCLRCNPPSLVLRIFLFPSYFWNFSCAWWCTSLILAFWRQRQVDVLRHSKFQASLSYIVRPVLKKTKTKNKPQTNNKTKPYEYVLPFDSFRSAH